MEPSVIEKELREQAEELGIGDHVLWLDKIDYKELPILYSLADVVINIPEQDGLPITVLEASACMTPVITSDLPAYQEFLSEGAYVRVRSGDVEALANAIHDTLRKSPDQLAGDLKTNFELVLNKAEQKKCFFVMKNIYMEAQKLA